MRFRDRIDAGCRLAERLKYHKESSRAPDGVVFALPRGGVVVGFPVAQALRFDLEPFVVRKVGAPHQEELAMGAVASGNITVRNQDIIRLLGVSDSEFEKRAQFQRDEVRRREALYREDRPPFKIEGRRVILVDDGLATGASMKAAVAAVRKAGPQSMTVAVPVAAQDAGDAFRDLLDRPGESFLCLYEPARFGSVGQWYEDFNQVEDREVCEILNRPREQGRTPEDG